MLLHTLVVGFEVNCYIVGSEEHAEAVVIDPGAEARRIFDVISERELTVKSIICTHGHYDHIGGVEELAGLTGADILVHPLDRRYLKDPSLNLSAFSNHPLSVVEGVRDLEGGETVEVGEMHLKVVHTPGHTPGGISIIAGEGVFCGDLIFAGSVGRVDFPGGSGEALLASAKEILALPWRLALYPGHGPATTIAEEKRSNPYLVGL